MNPLHFYRLNLVWFINFTVVTSFFFFRVTVFIKKGLVDYKYLSLKGGFKDTITVYLFEEFPATHLHSPSLSALEIGEEVFPNMCAGTFHRHTQRCKSVSL